MPFIWKAVQRSPLDVFWVKHLCAEVSFASGEFQPPQTHLYIAFKQTQLHLSVFPLADAASDGHVPRHAILAGWQNFFLPETTAVFWPYSHIILPFCTVILLGFVIFFFHFFQCGSQFSFCSEDFSTSPDGVILHCTIERSQEIPGFVHCFLLFWTVSNDFAPEDSFLGFPKDYQCYCYKIINVEEALYFISVKCLNRAFKNELLICHGLM